MTLAQKAFVIFSIAAIFAAVGFLATTCNVGTCY